MGYLHWINARTIRNHLDWYNRESTAFISVFSTQESAAKRAKYLRSRGFQGVKVAKLSCDSLKEGILSIQFQDSLIDLPVLEDALTVFFPVSAANRLLNLQHPMIMAEEWLALDHIPRGMITWMNI